MIQKRIFFIFCSKEDCLKLFNFKIPPYVHFNYSAIKNASSLKKIFTTQKKHYQPQKQDYIIAIENENNCKIKKDYENNKLLHFSSLQQFGIWFNTNFQH